MNEQVSSHATSESPFVEATSRLKRLKLLVYGDSGTGKTTLGLSFPRPVLFDLESGGDLYGGKFRFDVLRTVSFDEALNAIRWLREHAHPYRTVIVDPITILWDALQRKWSDIFLKRNKSSKGFKFEYFDFQPRDWMTIKAEWKELLRQLIALDATVVVTAREKVLYSDSGFMTPAGHTFEAEKGLAYAFDVVLRLTRDPKGCYLADVIKDRSGRLPTEPFEHSYALFERVFGAETFAREAKPIVPASEEQVREVRALVITLGLRDALVRQRLAAFGADRIEALSTDAASEILAKLRAARDAKSIPTQKES